MNINDDIQPLVDAIGISMEEMTQRVIQLYDEESMIAASSILNEWTLPNDTCVLTEYVKDSVHTIQGELLFVVVDDPNLNYGSYFFDPDVELPIDNN